MDTLTSMRAFARVVETKNFTQAAKRLKLSPAMVTKHIQSLEQRIGTRLVNRSTRQLSLTEAGAAYYERCVQLLADIEDAEEAAGSLGALPRGHLRISAPMYFGVTEVRPIVQEFMRKYPDITVDFLVSNRNVDLIEEGRDLAVRVSAQGLPPALIARRLATSRLMMCASPKYLKQAGNPRTPSDLAGHRCLAANLFRWTDGWTFRRGAQTETVKVSLCLQSNNNELLTDAAADGMGIAIHPSFNVCGHIAAGRLVTLLDDWSIGDVGVFVVFPSRKFLPAKTRLLIDFITAAFPRGPDHDPWFERVRGKLRRR
jgi:DNA-binding transcriptional LysR family regulator